MKKTNLACAVGAGLLALSGAASAITTVEQNSSIPFNFSNPGARSLAMGGAFIGLADDATAAYTNPAGLTGLGLEQQIGIEVRRTSTDAQYATGGSASLNPFDRSGVEYGSASDSSNNVSFLSWVLPREDWAFALYRHEMLNYESGYAAGAVGVGPGFTNPYFAAADLSVTTYGASFAYDINDHLALGAGLSWHDFEISTATGRFEEVLGGLGVESALVSAQTQFGDDHDIGYNLGLIYRGSDNFNIGLSYRSAPEFDYRASNIAGPAFLYDFFAPGVFTGELLADQTVEFKAPDMFGVGFSWRPTDALTINLDVNKVNYSNLSEDIVSPFLNSPDNPLTVVTQVPFVFEGVNIPAGTPITDLVSGEGERIAAAAIEVDDTFETHLGMEYAMTNFTHPVFLRFGVWHEPRHTLRFDIDPESLGASTPEQAELARVNGLVAATVFSTGSDEMHYSGGVGLAFASFQVDFAVDLSDRQDIFSVSGVWRF
jgi:long-chain fatty acid transport protein